MQYECDMCNFKTTSHKKADEHSWRTSHKVNGLAKDEPIDLRRINEIEDPRNQGKRVRCTGIIGSTSIAFQVPTKLEVWIEGEKKATSKEFVEIPLEEMLTLVKVSSYTKNKTLDYIGQIQATEAGKVVRVEESEFGCLYWIRVRPEVLALQLREGKILDEEGFEYKTFDVYVLSKEKQINFEPSKIVQLEGKVLSEPNQQRITLLVDSIVFPSEETAFSIVKVKTLKGKLDSFQTLKEKIDWTLIQFSLYSGVVNRRNIAFLNMLIYFTPLYLTFNDSLIRGWGNGLVMGDSTTGKSETSRKSNKLLNAGMYITAETASQAGLSASAVNIEKRGWFVDWGFLVLQDRRLLIIDGAHRLSRVDWSSLAESERTGTVIIAKAAKDQAYARTRQIKIANALDRETWQTEKMNSFLYPAQALPTILDKTNIARLDLAVFAKSDDVKIEDVDTVRGASPDPELELMGEALKFCWSSKASTEFEKEATQEILDEATKLYKDFHYEDIPLVSIDIKDKIARLSAALAFLTLSTDEEFTNVVVTKEHVKAIVNFIREEYTAVGLNILAKQAQHEVVDIAETDGILKRLSSVNGLDLVQVKEIISFIVLQGRVTSESLKQKFSLAEKNQLRPLIAALQNDGLIRAGKGFYSSAKLIQLYKIACGGSVIFDPGKAGKSGNNNNGEAPKEDSKAKAAGVAGVADPQEDTPAPKTSTGSSNWRPDLEGERVEKGGKILKTCKYHSTLPPMDQQAWIEHLTGYHSEIDGKKSGRPLSERSHLGTALHIFKRLQAIAGKGERIEGQSLPSVEDRVFIEELVKSGKFNQEEAAKMLETFYRGGQIFEKAAL